MKGFGLAMRFLTILPWPEGEETVPDQGTCAAAVIRFSWVGLLLGLILAVLNAVLGRMLPAVAVDAVLVVALAVMTGGLHLDGLSDLADAIGGGANPEERLRIMKDSACGPMGAAAIACVLLLKFAALRGIPAGDKWAALLLAPALGRAAMAYLLGRLPYARPEGGTGRMFAEAAGRAEGNWAIAAAAGACVLLGFGGGIFAAAVSGILAALLARYLERILGGGTGDAYGAAGEIIETAALLSFALWWG
ncbi:MAG: adenosylcobinamide-GDP ribazoletransferase [bacterium]|nr:adenosylcobinamide-GDP ribazoletransferase [bacterium]